MTLQQLAGISLLLALIAGLIFSKRSPALWFGGALLLSYLMVYSAGNYQLKDYARIGIPMALVYSTVVLLCLPHIYPF